ncbi:glutamine--fructose-6-phosphate aminotransferase [Prauserella marina]|uniref:Glutamine--fructose-6-phosphate aminotransferase [isomerizing] n=1 Tax=Prauserella marina TaxID=530584 RepID=A0A222VJ97_9PSEU|nr:glutamine--fructose-6-phosphate transaminase (isomerizing) [Prauserella marina]ASR33843.1 glutamine--fructose-6-phosphate aminotransferase [Prauserella marina]PWV82429.1 glutamine--fructose-6-phosphate transaminase [Prauserella marina]SDC68987.1 glucosamine--fructose-6-phosphate aminotransferase (isomerizing) [Prauserella marina]
MCGIVGYLGSRPAAPILLEGLHRLEYRGYDSAGIALPHRGRLRVTKAAVRVAELRALVGEDQPAVVGIGHTRWATHGEPNDANAHPHTDATGRVAVVHNGIIENAGQLRARLAATGVEFVSDTDTEALAHLIAARLAEEQGSLEDAVRSTLREVEGAYGIVVLDARNPGELVVARNGSPIVLGIGDGEMFIASDLAALVRHTQRVVYLDDGELATLRADDYRTSTLQARRTDKTPTEVELTEADYGLDGFADYMRKEIGDQPEAMRRALLGRLDSRFSTAHLGGLRLDPRELRSIRRVKFLGCGSAYYAGQIGANLVEELARLPADAEPASEFRYRDPVVDPETLYVAVSQSGETADTLAAVQELTRKGGRVIGAVNVVGSAIARECGSGVFLHAGPEVSVASTKAVTNMSTCFAMLALLLGRVRDLSVADGRRIVAALDALPRRVEEVFETEEVVADAARRFAGARHMFFVGRVRGWPVAREGAQKLKEISYVHAEAYQAGELKHGPIALIDSGMPSVVIVPDDELLVKNIGTMEQIKARGGPVIAVTNATLPEGLADAELRVPRTEPELDPILFGIPLQLLAYHLATELGRDIDKPRNLAKSVTVE